MRILAADIGGTHARFMVFDMTDDGRLRARVRARYRSAELASTPMAFQRLAEAMGGPVEAASIAVAGAVSDGEAVLTNLDWHIRRTDLASALGTERVHLLNDFEAIGYALPHLTEDDFVVVQEGSGRPGIQAVLGAGTGLGQAVVVTAAGTGAASVHPTEGGHVTYAPRSDLEWELRRYLAARHDHVSWERVLSGSGLGAIYDFLVEAGELSENPATRKAMSDRDPARVIIERALEETDAVCARALDLFIEAYGARAGDVALSTGAIGGIYLAGGIAVRLRDRLLDGRFLSAFLDKGRMSRWLEHVPVRVLARDDAGTAGAAVAALDVSVRGRISALPNAPEVR